MKKLYLATAIFLSSFCQSWAVSIGEVRFHNESTDTIKINSILSTAIAQPTTAEKIINIAQQFIDTPYAAGTLECIPERLTVNLDSVDCTTFVETVLALAQTANEQRTSWRDFIFNLEHLRYRNGKMNGYSSRLHYISDWIVDNTHRGNITEVTNRIPRSEYTQKSLDFMTANRDKYPALSDENQFLKVKSIEMGYRSHRFPYIKREMLSLKDVTNALRDGDVVAITTRIKNLDVTHIGIIKKFDGVPHLLHASSAAGKVIIDPLPLYDYIRRSNSNTGIRVIRLND